MSLFGSSFLWLLFVRLTTAVINLHILRIISRRVWNKNGELCAVNNELLLTLHGDCARTREGLLITTTTSQTN
jgi:hypothetical protein